MASCFQCSYHTNRDIIPHEPLPRVISQTQVQAFEEPKLDYRHFAVTSALTLTHLMSTGTTINKRHSETNWSLLTVRSSSVFKSLQPVLKPPIKGPAHYRATRKKSIKFCQSNWIGTKRTHKSWVFVDVRKFPRRQFTQHPSWSCFPIISAGGYRVSILSVSPKNGDRPSSPTSRRPHVSVDSIPKTGEPLSQIRK